MIDNCTSRFSVNWDQIEKLAKNWREADPFPHMVVDNFLDHDLALKLEDEFPDFDDSSWHQYQSALEVKKDMQQLESVSAKYLWSVQLSKLA